MFNDKEIKDRETRELKVKIVRTGLTFQPRAAPQKPLILLISFISTDRAVIASHRIFLGIWTVRNRLFLVEWIFQVAESLFTRNLWKISRSQVFFRLKEKKEKVPSSKPSKLYKITATQMYSLVDLIFPREWSEKFVKTIPVYFPPSNIPLCPFSIPV